LRIRVGEHEIELSEPLCRKLDLWVRTINVKVIEEALTLCLVENKLQEGIQVKGEAARVEMPVEVAIASCPRGTYFGTIHTHPGATSNPSHSDLIYMLQLYRLSRAPLYGIIGYDTTATFCWVERAPTPRDLRRWLGFIERTGVLPPADLRRVLELITRAKMKAEFLPPPPPGPRLRDLLRS